MTDFKPILTNTANLLEKVAEYAKDLEQENALLREKLSAAERAEADKRQARLARKLAQLDGLSLSQDEMGKLAQADPSIQRLVAKVASAYSHNGLGGPSADSADAAPALDPIALFAAKFA